MSMDQPGMSRPPWDQPYLGAEGAQQPPRKKGLSCGCIVLIILTILLVLLALLCCGGVAGMAYYLSKAVSEDPEVIAQVTAEIAQIDIPDDLNPGASFNMKIPFTGERFMVWVVYMDEGTQSMLVLGSLGGPLAEEDQQDVFEGIQASLEDEGVGYDEDVRHWETYEKEIEVRGEPVTFHFATGADASGKKRIRVTGGFQGQQGPTMFSFSGDAKKYDEQTVIQMIESIR